MSETALATRNEYYLAPAAEISEILRAYQIKHDVIEKVLHKDLDYGPIPGSTKPALLKPGAEKLANIFGLSPVFEDIATVEDWTGAEHGGEPFFYYRQKCKLYQGERLMGSADGSCNSHEKKYRYRQADRTCPDCGKATIFKSKPPKSGFYCWSKKGGCGAQFQANDKRITDQETGQMINPDIAEQVNTILKMAQKRALVAATLIVTGASDYFTQDIDDFIDVEYVDAPATVVAAAESLGATVTDTTPAPQPPTGSGRPGAAMVNRVKALVEQAEALHMVIEQVDYSTITAADLAAYGKALKERIAEIEQRIPA